MCRGGGNAQGSKRSQYKGRAELVGAEGVTHCKDGVEPRKLLSKHGKF
jgi:hypothetical protein